MIAWFVVVSLGLFIWLWVSSLNEDDKTSRTRYFKNGKEITKAQYDRK